MDAQNVELLRAIDPVVLGDRLRTARSAAGLTQGELASDDVTVSYVSRIEAGQRRPDPRVLERFAERLGLPVEQLLVGLSRRDDEALRLEVDYVELSLELGDAAAALTRVDELLAGETLASSSHHPRACLLRARALEATGQMDAAIDQLEELQASDPPGGSALAVGIALSRCYREVGDFGRAVSSGEALLSKLGEQGLGAGVEAIQLTVTVAAAYFEQGDTHFAVRLCRDAIVAAEQSGSPEARASAYWNASMMELERGAVTAAVSLAERALALLGEGRDARNLARLRSQLGIMQLQLDPPQLDEATHNLESASRAFTSTSASRIDTVRNDVALARAMFLRGDYAGARRGASAGHAAAVGTAPLLAADARALEGQAAAAEGDVRAARAFFREAVFILTGVGADRSAGQLWLELGALLESVGEHDVARDAYRSAAVSAGLRLRGAVSDRVR